MNQNGSPERDVDQMAEAELAEHYFAHRDDPDMFGDQVGYSPPRTARVAVRLSFDEERRIRTAADQAGMTISSFLRRAALDAADRRSVVDIERLRRDVHEARSRIDDAWQALAQ